MCGIVFWNVYASLDVLGSAIMNVYVKRKKIAVYRIERISNVRLAILVMWCWCWSFVDILMLFQCFVNEFPLRFVRYNIWHRQILHGLA